MQIQFDKEDQMMIRNALRKLVSKYLDGYWRMKDERREYAEEFCAGAYALGVDGVNIPLEYGGAGYKITEASIVLEELSASNGGLLAAGAAQASFF